MKLGAILRGGAVIAASAMVASVLAVGPGTGSLASGSSPDEFIGGGGCAGTTLYAGHALAAGGDLCSSSGGYELIMQSDGNLVVYSSSGQPRWASGTYGIGGGTSYLTVQGDSNVVIYDSQGAVWAVRWFSPQTYAQEIMFHYGWDQSQWPYLDQLWQHESNWEWYVCYGGGTYPNCNYSGAAYGIPQANPGDKMASVAPDWMTDPFTQVTWGEQYIHGAYGNPENAYGYSQRCNPPPGQDCGYVLSAPTGD